jgi:hypothetical protein
MPLVPRVAAAPSAPEDVMGPRQQTHLYRDNERDRGGREPARDEDFQLPRFSEREQHRMNYEQSGSGTMDGESVTSLYSAADKSPIEVAFRTACSSSR